MLKETYVSTSLEDTETLAKKIVDSLHGGEVLLLKGNLGAGKTALTKAIAKMLGITADVTSPTFSLMNTYAIPQKNWELVHVDTYRMESAEEIMHIGLQDYWYQKDTITIIEWPDLVKTLLPNDNAEKTILIEITGEKDGTRTIEIERT